MALDFVGQFSCKDKHDFRVIRPCKLRRNEEQLKRSGLLRVAILAVVRCQLASIDVIIKSSNLTIQPNNEYLFLYDFS